MNKKIIHYFIIVLIVLALLPIAPKKARAVDFGITSVGNNGYEFGSMAEENRINIPGETSSYDAITDAAGNYLYLVTTTLSSPSSKVIKIDLATYTKVATLSLDTGDDAWPFSSFISGSFLYIPANTGVGGGLIKIDLNTFTKVGFLPIVGGVQSATYDPVSNFAYVVDTSFPQEIHKINLTTFTDVGSLVLGASEIVGYYDPIVIDTLGGNLYVGANDGNLIVIKINLGSFTRTGTLIVTSSDPNPISLVIDSSQSNLFLSTLTLPGEVHRINLSSFTQTGTLPLGSEGYLLSPFSLGGNVYFSTDCAVTCSPRIVKIDTTTLARSDILLPGENYAAAMIRDPAGNFAYISTEDISNGNQGGRVVKLSLSSETIVNTLDLLPAYNGITSSVIDPNNNYAYFGTSASPGRIIKVDLSNFSTVGFITLNSGEDNLRSAVIDSSGNYAYFGTNTSPGSIIKIDLNTFTRVGAITLSAGENMLWSAVTDPINGFAYFGTNTIPGRVVKININHPTFSRVGAVILSAGENTLSSAVIDPANGFAYFGTDTSPGRVVKINVSPASFGRVSAIPLNTGENRLYSAAIDNSANLAYFGTNTSPGRVIKVNTNPASFARTSAVTLSLISNLYSASINPVGNFAYFTGGGDIAKINLSTMTQIQRLVLSKPYPFTSVFDNKRGVIYSGTSEQDSAVFKISTANNIRSGYIRATKSNLASPAAIVDSLSFYSHIDSGSPVRFGLYDSSLNLVWQSNPVNITSSGSWQTILISNGTPSSLYNLPAGDYYIGWQVGEINKSLSLQTGIAGDGFIFNQAYGSFPSSISTLDPNYTSTNEKWSAYISYTDNNSPNNPSSLGPANHVNGSTINTTNPNFSFNLSDPDVGDQVRYRIQVDNTAGFASPEVDYTSDLAAQGLNGFTVGQPAGGGSYTIGSNGQTLADLTDYYWRVKTIDDKGAESGWVAANGGGIAFSILINGAPQIYALGPAELINGLGSSIKSPRTFEFTTSDPDLDNITYYFELDDNDDFSSPLESYTSPVLTGNTTNRQYTSGNLTVSSYYWRVKIEDEHGVDSGWVYGGCNEIAGVCTTPSFSVTLPPSVYSLPSIITLDIKGIGRGESVDGELTNIPTVDAPSAALVFGNFNLNQSQLAAFTLKAMSQRSGYIISISQNHDLISEKGEKIIPFPATNQNPKQWFSPAGSVNGFFGYSVEGIDRFNNPTKYAGLTNIDQVIIQSDQPENISRKVIFKLELSPQVKTGTYRNEVIITIVGKVQ